MTKEELRQKAAISAMQAMLTGLTNNPSLAVSWSESAAKDKKVVSDLVAEFSVTYADKLVAELEKED